MRDGALLLGPVREMSGRPRTRILIKLVTECALETAKHLSSRGNTLEPCVVARLTALTVVGISQGVQIPMPQEVSCHMGRFSRRQAARTMVGPSGDNEAIGK